MPALSSATRPITRRRPARRRLVRRQRAELASGRRGRPRRQNPSHGLPPGSSRRIFRHRSRASVPGRAVQAHPQEPPDRAGDHRQGQPEDHGHAHPVLGRSRNLQRHRRIQLRAAHRPCAPDQFPGAGTADHRHRRERAGNRRRQRRRDDGSRRRTDARRRWNRPDGRCRHRLCSTDTARRRYR